MLQRWQIGLLHSAPQSLGVEDEVRKLVQRNVGGAESAAKMDYRGFLACMAWWDAMGWTDPVRGAGWWGKQDRSGLQPRRAKAIRLATLLRWTADGTDRGRVDFRRLDAFCQRQTMSRPRPRAALRECDRADLDAVIEGLKAMCLADEQARELLRT